MPLAGRASSRGCILLSDAEYLQLLDWTGRQIRKDKRGAVASELAPILERRSVTSDSWLKLVTSFRSLFRQSVGLPSNMAIWLARLPAVANSGCKDSQPAMQFSAPRHVIALMPNVCRVTAQRDDAR